MELGVNVSADSDQIKRAYKKQSVRFHPDKHQGECQNAKDGKDALGNKLSFYQYKFNQIKMSYDFLQNRDKRSKLK